MKRVIRVVFLTLLVASCNSSPSIREGKVVERKFSPAHWEGGYEYYTDYGYTCGIDYSGKYTCGVRPHQESRWEDQHIWKDDRFELQLENCERNDKDELKCRRGWITVPESEYGRYAIGVHYPDPT